MILQKKQKLFGYTLTNGTGKELLGNKNKPSIITELICKLLHIHLSKLRDSPKENLDCSMTLH